MLRNIEVIRQQGVPLIFKKHRLKKNLVLDLLVENKVIVEVKATEKHQPLYEAQLLTYLRLTEKRLGLVINFGKQYLRDGIHRVVNGLS